MLIAPWFMYHMLFWAFAVLRFARQFHMGFVEQNGERSLELAGVAIPSVIGMTLFIIPIALAGKCCLPWWIPTLMRQ